MKKNIDYYPHKTEAHRHPKFKMLRSLYGNSTEGWAAEGRFWALNNLIASSEDCKLDLTKKRNKGVFADELGISILEFEKFIKILVSEDVELLTELEPDIYTTDTVQDTYSSVSQDREKARDKKMKSSKNTSSEEIKESSDELLKSSGEQNNKVNKSELNKMKLNKMKVNEIGEITSSLFFEKCKKLYQDFTHIQDPNIRTHILPIVEIYNHIPEDLDQNDVEECIELTFKSLDKNKGVNVSFLCENINSKITERHERVIQQRKKSVLKDASELRIRQNKEEKEEINKKQNEIIQHFKEFYNKNPGSFTYSEKSQVLHFLHKKDVLRLEKIMKPKMKELTN